MHDFRRQFVIVFVCMVFIFALGACKAPTSASDTVKKPADLVQPTQPTKPMRLTDGQTPIISSPNDNRRYDYFTLPNKMQVVLVNDPDATQAAASLSVEVGSNQDPDDFLGLAHYLEHMLFLGTKKYPEVGDYARFIEQHGGSRNAYTDRNHTNYYFSIKSQRFDDALDRFSDFFKAPTLDPKYADKERHAVDSELKLRGAVDSYIEFALLGKSINPAHPSSRFRIGSLKTLSDKNDQTLHQALVAFYQRYYSANLMKLVLVANQPVDDLKALAIRFFSAVPNRDTPAPTIDITAIPPEYSNLQIFYRSHEDKKQLYLEFPIPYQPDNFYSKPYDLISQAIGSEMPGTLMHTLVKDGYIQRGYTQILDSAFSNAGVYRVVYDLTEKGVGGKDHLIASTFSYIRLLTEKGIPVHTYDELSARLKNAFAFQAKVNELSTAQTLSANAIHYPVRHIINHGYILQPAEPLRIKQAMAYLSFDNLRLWHISKKEKTDTVMEYFDGHYRIDTFKAEDKQRLLALSKAINHFQLPAPNRLLPRSLALVAVENKDRPEKVIDDKNLTLWHANSKTFNEPKSVIQLELNSDLPKQSIKHAVLHHLLVNSINHETQSLRDEAFAASMQSRYFNANGLTISVSNLSDRQGELLAKLVAALKDLDLSASTFEQQKMALRQSYTNTTKQFLISQSFHYFRKVMRRPAWEEDEKTALLDKLSLSDFNAYKIQFLNAVNVHMFVFGNQSVKHAGEIARTIAKEFKHKGNDRALETVYPIGKNTRLNITKSVQQTDASVVSSYFSTGELLPATAASMLLSTIVNAEFSNQLRTKEQLGYVVGISPVSTREKSGLALFIQSPVKGPEAILKRFDQFISDFIPELNAITQEQFDEVKSAQLTTLKTPAKNIYEEASTYIEDWRQGLYQYDSNAQLIKAIESTSLDDLKTFYHELLVKGIAGRIIVQMKGTQFQEQDFFENRKFKPVKDISRLK